MNFYSRMKKFAIRGNIERMNDPFSDPYQRRAPISPGNGDGQKLTTPGGEDFGGGLGTRFRGKDMPREISPSFDSEYENQSKADIPTSTHMFISNDEHNQDSTMKGSGTGVDSTVRQDFTDYRDKLPIDSEIWTNDPVGPFNMSHVPLQDQAKRRLFDKVKDRIQGTYF